MTYLKHPLQMECSVFLSIHPSTMLCFLVRKVLTSTAICIGKNNHWKIHHIVNNNNTFNCEWAVARWQWFMFMFMPLAQQRIYAERRLVKSNFNVGYDGNIQ